MNNILFLFHHIHHNGNEHEVHHCGGKHNEIDPSVDYVITHCNCGQHSINKEEAIGHAANEQLESEEVKVKFTEKCPQGGWHLESGVRI
jgi:hypothetical protein